MGHSEHCTKEASGHINQIEVNYLNPDYCHVQPVMTPSMKQGNYTVYGYFLGLRDPLLQFRMVHASVLQGKIVRKYSHMPYLYVYHFYC